MMAQQIDQVMSPSPANVGGHEQVISHLHPLNPNSELLDPLKVCLTFFSLKVTFLLRFER